MYPRGGNGFGSAGDADGYDLGAKRPRLLSSSVASGFDSYYSSPAAAAAAAAGLNPGLNSYQPNSSPSLQPIIAPYSSGSSSSLSSSLSSFLPGSPPRSTLPPSLGSYGAGSPPPYDTKGSPYISDSSAPLQAGLFGGPGYLSTAFSQARAFPAVRLRGLPFNCTESDVYEFFAGLDVVDVLLTHKQGRFSGEAYCVFGAPMQVDFALQRNRQNMGQRYIEVFRSKKQEYYSAVAAEVTEISKPTPRESAPSLPPPKAFSDKEHLEHTGVLKLRGLPFSASKRDIKEFFKGFGLTDESIHFIIHTDGRATGEAYVEFSDSVQSKEAMCRDKKMLGSRYVELFPASREEAVRAVARFKK